MAGLGRLWSSRTVTTGAAITVVTALSVVTAQPELVPSAAAAARARTSTAVSATPAMRGAASSFAKVAARPAPTATLQRPNAARLNKPLPVVRQQKVLLFGDSMADAGLSQRLRALLRPHGVTLVSSSWKSSTTTHWIKSPRLPELLAVHRPNVVLIALGANEVFLGTPDEAAPNVERIVAQLGGRPCAWIAPPLWKGDTGITRVIREHAGPCTYLDGAEGVAIARQPDGIHPTLEGGRAWADWAFPQLFAIAPQGSSVLMPSGAAFGAASAADGASSVPAVTAARSVKTLTSLRR